MRFIKSKNIILELCDFRHDNCKETKEEGRTDDRNNRRKERCNKWKKKGISEKTERSYDVRKDEMCAKEEKKNQ